MAKTPSAAPAPQLRIPSNSVMNTIAKHILLSKKYPKALPQISSITKSLPAIMRGAAK